MKKIILSALLLTATCFYSFAQSSAEAKVSVGADVGIPLGDANKLLNLVYGPSVKVEIPFSASGPILTLNGSYEIFNPYNPNDENIESPKYATVAVGIKDYFQNSIIFLEGDIGESFFINSNYTGKSGAFMYAPAMGVSLAKNKLDISVRYEERDETYGKLGFTALRIAYKFGVR